MSIAASSQTADRAEPSVVGGVIFDLQRFSVHDGPGIRSLVFLKGCPLRCPWCANPESQRSEPELLFDPAKCVGCGACRGVCPAGASQPPALDRTLCRGCGRCVDGCYAEARTLAGRRTTAGEVFAALFRDEPFFRNSGGGVTLGGGEPLAQPGFAAAILALCRQRGLHTVVETCAHGPWTAVEAVRSCTDLFLVDVKHLDPVRHREATGGDVATVLANLDRLAREAAVIVRTPVIPGFNDDPATVRAIAGRARAAGVAEMHLLPFHRLGRAKYARLGRRYAFEDVPPMPHAALRELAAAVATAGLRVHLEGEPAPVAPGAPGPRPSRAGA